MKAEQLRKSILQLAIQGKLVPQDPADEPASVLLERIRTEKQRLIKEGKIKKDKGDSVIFKGDDNCYYEKTGSEVKNITDEIPFDIPDSWCWVRLGNVCKITMGQSPDGNSVNFFNGIEFHQGKIYFGKKYLQKSNQKTTNPTKVIDENAVVLCVRAPVGKVNIVERKICIGRGLCAIIPIGSVPISYIYFLFQTYEETLNKKATGTTFKAINNEIIFNQLIPLPPLSEQERIVAEIEKFEPLIAEYDKLEQQATKLDSEIYDKLKKSILQYAIQGKLVPQDSNDEPASVLLERIRAEKKAQLGKKYVESYIYKGDDNCYYEHINGKNIDITEILPIDIPDNWAWVKLGYICFVTKLAGFEYTKYIAPNLTTAGVPIFKGKNVQDGEIIYKFEGYIPESISDMLERSQVRKKCILTPYVGTIGNLGIHNRNGHYHLGSNVGKIELLPYNITSEEYIVLYLKSMYGYGELTKNKKATAQESISIEAIREVYIPIPPLAEQKRIVEKIDEIFAKL
jgi:type I restriction enzyme S subunit